jgi:hypothetical protein
VQLANAGEVDQALFEKELAGSNGSLRSFAGLEGWEIRPLHATHDDAEALVKLHWSTAVGPMTESRKLKLVRQGSTWRVVWPSPEFPSVPAQVVSVNYLRWDLVTPSEEGSWGGQNVDSPRVRIVSMNAAENQGGTVVMGEVLNEDTVPAFIDVNAQLLDSNGAAMADENSFDKIAHVLLPKQNTPYRIDFPGVDLARVKNVHIDIKATLVPASADPLIAVMNQTLTIDEQGHKLLQGDLLNEGGQVVNVPHIIAGFYGGDGKVVWVADSYVDHALLPQVEQPFAIEIPKAVAEKVQNYHVVVNHYNLAQ